MKRLTRDQTKIKKALFLERYKTTFANVSISAAAAGINRGTYYKWRKKDKKFKIECDDILEHVGDFVESKLLNAINADNITGIIFFCKTRLKNRGYVERSELTGKDEAPLIPAQIVVTKAAIKDELKRLNEEF